METAASLLKAIGKSIEDEHRTAPEIFADIKKIGATMMLTNVMTQNQVVFMCAGLCKLYLMLKEQ